MTVPSTPDYSNAPSLDLDAVREAREAVKRRGEFGELDVSYTANLLKAYDALAARHAMLSAFSSGDPDR